MATPTHSSDRSLRVELVLRVKVSSEGGASFSVLREELLHGPQDGAWSSGWSCYLGLVVELLLCPQCGAAPQGGGSSSFGISLHPEGSVGVVPLCSPGVAELQVPAASV